MRDNEEIFLLALIYQYAIPKRTNWGTENDILTDIGWPAKPGDPLRKVK